jgi:hypothetical protein
MAKRSRVVFEFFAEEIGGSAAFIKTGYLFFVPDYVEVRLRQILGFSSKLA